MRTAFRLILAVTLVTVATFAIVRQHRINDRLRRQLAFGDRLRQERETLELENRRLAALLARRDTTQAAPVVTAELEKMRAHVAALERRTQDVARHSEAGDVSANRDPEKGMVSIEHFKNAGRATPAAAFQTAIWASANADFDTLALCFLLSPAGRAAALAQIAKLPADTRARFPTPEKLVAVPFAHDFGEEEGYQIVRVDRSGADEALVRVRRLKHGRVQPSEKKIPFRLGPSGWQIVIPDRAIESLPDYITSASLRMPTSPKR